MRGGLELSDASRPPAQKIYEHKLRQIAGVGKVSLAVGHGSHLLDEVDQIIIARQHESVNHYTGFAAGLYLFEGLRHHQRVAAHRVYIEPPRSTTGFVVPS